MNNDPIWQARSLPSVDTVRLLQQELCLLPLTASLLAARGYDTPESAREFLSLSSAQLHDPYLLPDMQKAVERISLAIDRKEQVAIYGDYDVDGVTSTATMVLWLRSMGLTPIAYIPEREGEGYGMSEAALRQLKEQSATLIITVDNGVTAMEEAEICAGLGMDLVITDHHECQERLPRAIAVVNPRRQDSRYPFDGLAGVGVAFKLVAAVELYRHAGEDRDLILRSVCQRYIDLAAMGTVADVMPLVGENRFIVSRGLQMMEQRPRPAITALLDAVAQEKGNHRYAVNPSLISYTIAPRINAAGRMESAQAALRLFLCPPDEAPNAARYLCDCNRRRQEEENRILERVERKLKQAKPAHSIVLGDEDFSGGVIGIVAAKLTERYNVPTILISFDHDIGKGSGRAPQGIDLVKALEASSDLLIRYGGHTMAAGMTIAKEQLPAFAQRFDRVIAETVRETPVLEYDLALSPSQLTLRAAQELTLLEPCGAANPIPLFCWTNATIEAVMPLGERHTKLICTGEGISHPVLLFGTPRKELDLFPGDRIDLLFELSVNEFRGTTELQLIARGYHMAQGEISVSPADLNRWKALSADDITLLTPMDLPTREECGRVYRILRQKLGYGRSDLVSPRELMTTGEDYIKLRLILALLSQGGLATVTGESPLTVCLPPVMGKVDLTALPLWRNLHDLFSDSERRSKCPIPTSKNC